MTKIAPRDLSGSFSQVFNWIFIWIQWCFDTLDSISFMGITLLDFVIWVFVLSIILPLIITLLNSRRAGSRTESRRSRGKGNKGD